MKHMGLRRYAVGTALALAPLLAACDGGDPVGPDERRFVLVAAAGAAVPSAVATETDPQSGETRTLSVREGLLVLGEDGRFTLEMEAELARVLGGSTDTSTDSHTVVGAYVLEGSRLRLDAESELRLADLTFVLGEATLAGGRATVAVGRQAAPLAAQFALEFEAAPE